MDFVSLSYLLSPSFSPYYCSRLGASPIRLWSDCFPRLLLLHPCSPCRFPPPLSSALELPTDWPIGLTGDLFRGDFRVCGWGRVGADFLSDSQKRPAPLYRRFAPVRFGHAWAIWVFPKSPRSIARWPVFLTDSAHLVEFVALLLKMRWAHFLADLGYRGAAPSRGVLFTISATPTSAPHALVIWKVPRDVWICDMLVRNGLRPNDVRTFRAGKKLALRFTIPLVSETVCSVLISKPQ